MRKGAIRSFPRSLQLAADVKAILPNAQLTYAADWSEWFGHQPPDGSGDVFFHLDPLWSDANIAAVAFDNYWPLSDWRDTAPEHRRGGESRWHADRDHGLRIPDGQRPRRRGLRLVLRKPGGPRCANPVPDHGWRLWQALDFPLQGYLELVVKPAFQPAGRRRRGRRQQPGFRNRNPSGSPNSDALRSTRARTSRTSSTTRNRRKAPSPTSRTALRDYLIQRRYLNSMLRFFNPSDPEFTEDRNPQSPLYPGRMVDLTRVMIYTWDARPYPYFPLYDIGLERRSELDLRPLDRRKAFHLRSAAGA